MTSLSPWLSCSIFATSFKTPSQRINIDHIHGDIESTQELFVHHRTMKAKISIKFKLLQWETGGKY
ncbi:hypothetical protein MXB_3630 [Myxobolus squamalis]|nr:hypothetical protein MXB_3630 [Myxobolus squamalis]